MKKNIKLEVAIGVIFILIITSAASLWVINRKSTSFLNQSEAPDNYTHSDSSTDSTDENQDARLLFATNGQRSIYKEKRDDKWIVIIDGQESSPYDAVSNPTFSKDGTQFAYSAQLDGKEFVVLNSTPENKTYARIIKIAFSPDGKIIAYVAEKNGNNVVVINGKESKEYAKVEQIQTTTGSNYIVFSPDSQKIVYEVSDDTGKIIVVNNEEGKKYSEITDFTFNEDGTKYAYQANLNGQIVIVINNREIIPVRNGSSNSSNSDNSSSSSSSSSSSNSNNQGNQDHVSNDSGDYGYKICSPSNGCNF